MHYPTLPAKTLCSIPSTHLQGFRNYIATILKSYLRGMSIILLGLLWVVAKTKTPENLDLRPKTRKLRPEN